MPRPKSAIPAYTLHKPSGRARVRIDGKDHYLGAYGSEESRRRYGELVTLSSNNLPIDPITPATPDDSGPAVAVLVLAFLDHAKVYYSKDGIPNGEYTCFVSALKAVTDLFGRVPAKDFGPLQLKTVRERHITVGWTRKYCNKSVSRVRHVWKWGVENGLVPVTVWQALTAVGPLKRGKCDAPDNPKRQAVPDAHIEAVRPLLSEQCRDLLDLLRWTGARPAELLGLTWSMIDRSDSVWKTSLDEHKTAHHDKERRLYFGPRAQLVLRRLHRGRDDQPLFKMHHDTLAEALRQACDKAEVPRFCPYTLRHTHGTLVRDAIGHESAQAALGHSSPNMTAVYTAKLDKLAAEAAAKCG